MRDGPKLRIAFLLAPSFTLNAFANFLDVIRLSADEGDRSRQIRCQWRILSDSLAPIASSSGVCVQPTHPLSNTHDYDYLVVAGGTAKELSDLPATYRSYILAAVQAGRPIVGLCTGVLLLHQLGVLNGYKSCVSWFHSSDFDSNGDERRPTAEQIFVVDRDRLTCSGGIACAHLAAFIVERHLGGSAANKSLRIMMIGPRKDATAPQPLHQVSFAARNDIVKRAVLIMQQHLEFPIDTGEIAQMLDLSRRSLERIFASDLRMSPKQVYLKLRVDHGRQLLKETTFRLSQIAQMLGFSDAAHFSRHFRQQTGVTPAAFRKDPAALGG